MVLLSVLPVLYIMLHCLQGSCRAGTHRNAVPVLFFDHRNAVPVLFGM